MMIRLSYSRAIRALLLLAAATALMGCASLFGRKEPPRISLAALRVREIKGFESIFEVDLRVYNRSREPLGIEGVDLELTLDDQHLAQGVAGVSRQIAPYSSDIVPLTVYASMLDMAGLAHRLLKGDGARLGEQLPYALQGHVRVTGQWLFDRIPFESKGKLDLKQLAPAGR